MFDDFERKVKKTIVNLKSEYDVMRVGRANPKILDNIRVKYFDDSMLPINNLANIRVLDARNIVITPFDKSTLKAIEKALNSADIGITPLNDGDVLRLSFPQLTGEVRSKLIKNLKKLKEESKVSIRNLRRDEMDKLKKMKKIGDISEDELKDYEKKLQKVFDRYIDETESILEKKVKEIESV